MREKNQELHYSDLDQLNDFKNMLLSTFFQFYPATCASVNDFLEFHLSVVYVIFSLTSSCNMNIVKTLVIGERELNPVAMTVAIIF